MTRTVHSWLKGIGSVLDLWSERGPYRFTAPLSESEATSRDWTAVGGDLCKALNANVHRLPPERRQAFRVFVTGTGATSGISGIYTITTGTGCARGFTRCNKDRLTAVYKGSLSGQLDDYRLVSGVGGQRADCH